MELENEDYFVDNNIYPWLMNIDHQPHIKCQMSTTLEHEHKNKHDHGSHNVRIRDIMTSLIMTYAGSQIDTKIVRM